MIRLEEVGPENWRLGLKVSEEQRAYVADSAGLLARAYAYRNSRSHALVIYDGEVPVGMALYYDLDGMEAYDLSQFFIDARYQRRGFGTEAARQILARMERDGRFDKVYLCYIEGNDGAKRMYERLGFSPNGDRDGDEIVMEKRFSRA